jgi:universal stress protein A
MFAFRKILCPVDYSDASKSAVRYAVELAEPLQAEIHLLSVIPHIPVGPDMSVPYIPTEPHEIEASYEDLNKLKKELIPDSIKSKLSVISGDISQTILQVAERDHTNIIVIGSNGRTGLSRLILGSVSEAVVRKANVPVLVAKAVEKEVPVEH